MSIPGLGVEEREGNSCPYLIKQLQFQDYKLHP